MSGNGQCLFVFWTKTYLEGTIILIVDRILSRNLNTCHESCIYYSLCAVPSIVSKTTVTAVSFVRASSLRLIRVFTIVKLANLSSSDTVYTLELNPMLMSGLSAAYDHIYTDLQGVIQWGGGGGSFPTKTPSFPQKEGRKGERQTDRQTDMQRERRERGESVYVFGATIYLNITINTSVS